MPEGPSLLILSELLQPYAGKTVTAAEGYGKIDFDKLINKKILAIRSWGKHCLISFDDFYIRIHLLMFGSYRLDEGREINPVLNLTFNKGEINFYTCNVKLVEGKVEEDYDWETDIMSPKWNTYKALQHLKQKQNQMVCDVLLDQEIFSGSGNIIKNEVLFRTRIHPESIVGALPAKKLKQMVNDVPVYGQAFYEWKKENTLKRHWHIYEKKECPRCLIPVEPVYVGKAKRVTFCCSNCQLYYYFQQ